MTRTAAIVYICLCTVVVLFQMALALGAPWGHLAMGGQWPGTFSIGLRLLAVLQAALLVWFAIVVANRAGLVQTKYAPRWAIWVVFGVSTLSAIANVMTPSIPERMLWGPVATVMLISVVAIIVGTRGLKNSAPK